MQKKQKAALGIGLVVLALALFLFLGRSNTEGSLVGNWRGVPVGDDLADAPAMTLTLAKDHSFSIATGGGKMEGNWKLEGDKLTMVATLGDGQPLKPTPEQTQKLAISTDRKTLTPPKESPLVWQKIDSL